ncbi:hypothetical protein HDU93_005343 [Gonapodya sp. JEL0774]|nr:hypothetical protein HDU93_005343 [Gonapodya sp. JEL0774]
MREFAPRGSALEPPRDDRPAVGQRRDERGDFRGPTSSKEPTPPPPPPPKTPPPEANTKGSATAPEKTMAPLARTGSIQIRGAASRATKSDDMVATERESQRQESRAPELNLPPRPSFDAVKRTLEESGRNAASDRRDDRRSATDEPASRDSKRRKLEDGSEESLSAGGRRDRDTDSRNERSRDDRGRKDSEKDGGRRGGREGEGSAGDTSSYRGRSTRSSGADDSRGSKSVSSPPKDREKSERSERERDRERDRKSERNRDKDKDKDRDKDSTSRRDRDRASKREDKDEGRHRRSRK